MYPVKLENQIDVLNANLSDLNLVLKKSSESSSKNQKALTRWTAVMVFAIIVQAIFLGVQAFLQIKK